MEKIESKIKGNSGIENLKDELVISEGKVILQWGVKEVSVNFSLYFSLPIYVFLNE